MRASSSPAHHLSAGLVALSPGLPLARGMRKGHEQRVPVDAKDTWDSATLNQPSGAAARLRLGWAGCTPVQWGQVPMAAWSGRLNLPWPLWSWRPCLGPLFPHGLRPHCPQCPSLFP